MEVGRIADHDGLAAHRLGVAGHLDILLEAVIPEVVGNTHSSAGLIGAPFDKAFVFLEGRTGLG